jgi:hypothetical protein
MYRAITVAAKAKKIAMYSHALLLTAHFPSLDM